MTNLRENLYNLIENQSSNFDPEIELSETEEKLDVSIRSKLNVDKKEIIIQTNFLIDSTNNSIKSTLREQEDTLRRVLENPDSPYNQKILTRILTLQIKLDYTIELSEKTNRLLAVLYCILITYLGNDQVLEVLKTEDFLNLLGLIIFEFSLFKLISDTSNLLSRNIIINKLNQEYEGERLSR